MATRLDKELKRAISVQGVEYTVAIDPHGLRVTGKGKRTPQVELRWLDLVSGEAALAVALNASLTASRSVVAKPPTGKPTRSGEAKVDRAPAPTKRATKTGAPRRRT